MLTVPRVIAEAKRRFDLYVSGEDKSAVHPNLRAAVYALVIRYGGKSEFDFLKSEWHSTTSIDGRETVVRELGHIQDQTLLPEYLSLLFNDVATQDMHTGAIALAANPRTRPGLWKYFQENFESIKDRLGKNMVVLDRFILCCLNKFSDRETEKEIAKFFEGRDNRGYDRTLAIASDTILGRATYKERDGKVLLEWLKAHEYA